MAVRINLLKDKDHDLSYGVSKGWGAEGAERTRQRVWRRAWRPNNREKDRAAARDWARRNPDKAAARGRRFYEQNRDYVIQQSSQWQKDNRVARNAYNATRRKKYKALQPPWVDNKQIYAFYMTRTDGVEVDHIYPLSAEWVTGFHSPDNMQLLPESDNIKKFNRFSPKYHLNFELPRKLGGYPAVRMLTLDISYIRKVYHRSMHA